MRFNKSGYTWELVTEKDSDDGKVGKAIFKQSLPRDGKPEKVVGFVVCRKKWSPAIFLQGECVHEAALRYRYQDKDFGYSAWQFQPDDIAGVRAKYSSLDIWK